MNTLLILDELVCKLAKEFKTARCPVARVDNPLEEKVGIDAYDAKGAEVEPLGPAKYASAVTMRPVSCHGSVSSTRTHVHFPPSLAALLLPSSLSSLAAATSAEIAFSSFADFTTFSRNMIPDATSVRFWISPPLSGLRSSARYIGRPLLT